MRDVVSSTQEPLNELPRLLAASRALDKLMCSMPENTFIALLDGTIIRTSRSVQDNLGYSEIDLIGRSLLCLHSDEQRPQAMNCIQSLRYSRPINNTLEIICKGGIPHSAINTLSLAEIGGNPIIIMISRALASQITSQSPVCENRTLSVLYVEDSVANQQLMSAVLKRQGWGVVLAMNGVEGLDKFRQLEFDIILMDIQMPVMDGFQTVSVIRDEEREMGRNTPVIAVTANGGSLGMYLKAGFDEVVFKPFVASDLVRKIKKQAGIL
jgi:PAS domain S-box-containing protein